MQHMRIEKESGDMIRNYLTTTVGNQESQQVGYWQNNSNYQINQDTGQPILWSIHSNNVPSVMTHEMRSVDLDQAIPVTYLTQDERQMTYSTDDRSVTYILSPVQNLQENRVVLQEPINDSKVVLIENLNSGIIRKGTNNYVIIDSGVNFSEPNNEVIELQVVDVEKKNEDEQEGCIDQGKMANLQTVGNKRKIKEEYEEEVASNEVSVDVSCDKTASSQEGDMTSSDNDSGDDKPLILKKDKYIKQVKMKKQSKLSKGGVSKQKVKTPAKKQKKKIKKEQPNKETTKENKSDEVKKGEEVKVKTNQNELTKLEDNSEQVQERFNIGCECSESNCFDGLNAEKVFKHRLNIADLTKAEHDMYLMGVIMASMQNPEETCRHKERIRIRSSYVYQGKKVCLTAFLYLEHVTLYQMKRLRKHLRCHGVSPRTHGNHGRKPANTLSLDIYQQATEFVQSYIEQHSVKHVPNFTTLTSGTARMKNNKLKKIKIPNKMTSYHLPPECTKKTVHNDYRSHYEKLNPNIKTMQYSTFTSFLKKQFPNVKFHKVDKKDGVQSLEADDVNRVKKQNVQYVKKTIQQQPPQQSDNYYKNTGNIVTTGLQVSTSPVILQNVPYTTHVYTMHNVLQR